MICSHSQVERVSFCLCSRKVMKENCLLWYRVNLRVSQTMLNHKQNLFLIVCYCSVCLHWRVFKSFWVANLHSAARALSSPNQCFKLSRNFDKDFFCCLLCWDAATISSNAERLLISCVSFFNTVEYYTPINNSDSANKNRNRCSSW